MQQLDSMTLKHLAAELDGLLSGSKINKIQHVSPYEFLFGFWGARIPRRHRLYINVHPEHPCAFLIDADACQEFVITTLPKPTGFCMLLRKHLTSAKIVSCNTLPGERVMNLTLENYSELGNRVRFVLSLEFMGKHTNMVFVDTLQDVILGAAHTVSEEMSRFREVGSGLAYATPPQPEGKSLILAASIKELRQDFKNATAENRLTYMKEKYWGLATPILKSLLETSADADAFYEAMSTLDAGNKLHPSLSRDYNNFSLIETASDANPFETVHDMVAVYMRHHLLQKRLSSIKRELLQVLKRQQNKLAKRKTEQKAIDEDEMAAMNRYGNLILNAFSSGELTGKPTQSEIKLADYTTEQSVAIRIDTQLSWTDNAQRYFKKAKKEKSRQESYEAACQKIADDEAYTEALICLVNQGETLHDLLAVRQDLIQAGMLRDKSGRNSKKQQIAGLLETQSSDGMKLFVGKSGQANADLVGRLSRADDVWLHVHEMPGSHVVIKTGKQPVSDQTLLEAATLAAHYSSARHSKNVPVIYTQMRYVKKIPDSYPGHVNYREEKTVFITPQTHIINALIHNPEEYKAD